jgi:hypothetical protein
MKSCAVWPPRDCFYAHGIAPDATYRFKHAMIRDTAMKRCSGHGGEQSPYGQKDGGQSSGRSSFVAPDRKIY